MQTLTTTGAAGAEVTIWYYDAASGQMTSKVYADGKGPTYTYTPAGRLATRTWARGIVTTYGYNSAGELQSIGYSDGATPAASYSYDRLGRLLTASGGGSARALTYLGNTNLQTSETFTGGPTAGTSVSTGYDGLSRRISLQVGQGQTSLVSQSFGFDAASRLASASQGTASAAYSYVGSSAANLVQSIVFTNSGQLVMTTSKSYDSLDRLLSISSTVAGASTPVSGFAYTYNAANQRVRADVASDGSHWTYGYDGLGQVTSGTRQWSDNSAVGGQQFGYSFDSIGNRTSTIVNGRQSQYASNVLNEYSQRTVPGAVDVIGTANPAATVTINNQKAARQIGGYFYGTVAAPNSQGSVDASVNVTAVQLTSGNTANALDSQQGSVFVPQTPEVFTYDADGNLTGDGHWTYTWDGENRLIGMQALSALAATERKKLIFSYDDIGRRVQKQVLTWNASGSNYSPSTSTLFGCDGWNVVAELSGANAGALLRSYLWGIDLLNSYQKAGGIGALLAATAYAPNSTATTQLVAYDGNGNVSGLLKAQDHSLTGQLEFGPFGETVKRTGDTSSFNLVQFSSKYRDEETELSYYGVRYYNSLTGRWIGRDPSEEAAGLDLYGFLSNDSLDTVDGFGLSDVNISLFRSSYGFFNTYGRITISSSNAQAMQCCQLPKSWFTLELPWGIYPLYAAGHTRPATVVPMRTTGPGQPKLNPGVTTPNILSNENPPRMPAGMNASDYNTGINNTFNTGNGLINVHAGVASWNSLLCIIIGHAYVVVQVPSPALRSAYPNVPASDTVYDTYGFNYQDSLLAQTEFNAAIACVARRIGHQPTISFKLSPQGPPPWVGGSSVLPAPAVNR